MKAVVLILALLWVPLVIGGTVGVMVYLMRDKAARPQGVREFAVVGGVIAVAAIVVPLLILLRAF